MPGRALRPWALAVLLLAAVLPADDVGGQEWIVAPPPAREGDQRAPRIDRPAEDLLSINGALLSTLQWAARSDAARGHVFGSGSLDVTLTVRATSTMHIFVDVEGLAGQGPDERLGTLSRLNKNADDTLGEDTALRLMKLIVRESWLEDRILLSVGKLDLEDYFDRNAFAEDEATQFLNAAILTSPVLAAPEKGLGGAVRVSWGDWRYALGVSALDDIDGDYAGLPFVIAEIGRRNVFTLRGHYRLWARVSSVFEDRDRITWATGVSVDQLVTPRLGVFFRAGASRTQGERPTSWAWSAGLQFTAPWLGGNDTVGVGYSQQREADGRERVAEAYYRFVLTDWLSVIANVQWVLSGPNQVTGGEHRNLVVPGLRALVQF